MNKFKQIALNNDLLSAVFILLFSVTVLLPSLEIGLISDDFSWIALAWQGQGMPWMEYLSQAAPFGYFRPLPLGVFRILWSVFGDNYPAYRLIILCLNAFICLLIFLFLNKTSLPKPVPFLSAVIFAIMPSRSEALLWLCCLNEILAAFFVMAGLYVFSTGTNIRKLILSITLFTLALFSRESAFCYILLIPFLWIVFKGISWKRVLLISFIPAAFYFSLRGLWLSSLPKTFIPPTPGTLDLNPLAVLNRTGHYFIKILIPVKGLAELSGFELFQRLKYVYNSPASDPMLFFIMGLSVFLTGSLIIYLFWKISGKAIVYPLIFTFITLIVYLPFTHASERFLYLPSVGMAVLIALFLVNLLPKRPVSSLVILLLIFSAYSLALHNRMYRWSQVARQTTVFYRDLSVLADKLSASIKVYIRDLPSTRYGIPFLSYYTINDSWQYFYPNKKILLLSDPAPRPKDVHQLISYQEKNDSLKIINQ